MIPEAIATFGLAGAVMDVDMEEIDPLGIDTHERGGALPVVGVAPALAEGTAGVGPAGEAETASTAEPEALAPWMQGKTQHEVETPPQEGKREHEAPLQEG